MERWIDRANGHRTAAHRLEHAVEVVALQRQQLVERFAPPGFVIGEDHPLHDGNASLAKEHVLGPAQPDAAGAERVGQRRLIREIGVRVDAERAELVRPAEQLVEAAVDVGLRGRERAVDDLQNLAGLRRDTRDLHLARQAVERDVVALFDGLTVDADLFAALVDLEIAGADHRRLAHLPADDGGVRGHAARGGENPLRDEHPVDVVGHGLAPDENHLLALVAPLDGLVGREDNLTAGRAWRRRQTLRGDRNLLPLVGIEAWRKQLIEGVGIDEQDRFLRRDELFSHEIGRDDDSRITGPLAAAGLQHEELSRPES